MRTVVLVVDDEPDVELLFRQQFRHDLRAGRLEMEFSRSGSAALNYINDDQSGVISLILSDINMPGMNGIELLRKTKSAQAGGAGHHDFRVRRCGNQTQSAAIGSRRSPDKTPRFPCTSACNRQAGRAYMTAHILVVDDEPDIERLILQKFRSQIWQGVVALSFVRDGIEALNALH
jgi:CheY-like chemotaxis protein